MRKIFISLMIFGFCIGCATTYQKKGFTGGYSDTQLGENMFKVTFRGNGYTSSERALDFCLLRCADLAIEHEFPYFIIINASEDVSHSTYTTPTTATTTTRVDYFGNLISDTKINGGETYIISKPSAANTIVCFKEKPTDIAVVYDASFITNSIREKYRIKDR